MHYNVAINTTVLMCKSYVIKVRFWVPWEQADLILIVQSSQSVFWHF